MRTIRSMGRRHHGSTLGYFWICLAYKKLRHPRLSYDHGFWPSNLTTFIYIGWGHDQHEVVLCTSEDNELINLLPLSSFAPGNIVRLIVYSNTSLSHDKIFNIAHAAEEPKNDECSIACQVDICGTLIKRPSHLNDCIILSRDVWVTDNCDSSYSRDWQV